MVYPMILALDSSGAPNRWISWQESAIYVAKELVDWSLGEITFTFHGGKSRMTGETSTITTASIIAVKGKPSRRNMFRPVGLTNKALFRRDKNICAYCGQTFFDSELTRDHITPVSRGGRDVWMNVTTACKRCNHAKGNQHLHSLGWELLYVPYAPCRYEGLILNNKKVLADQMEFLASHIKNKDSRWVLQ